MDHGNVRSYAYGSQRSHLSFLDAEMTDDDIIRQAQALVTFKNGGLVLNSQMHSRPEWNWVI